MAPQQVTLVHRSLRIAVDFRPPTLEVALTGSFDSACTYLLEAVQRVHTADLTVVILDVSDLSHCDLPGLHALIEFHDAQRMARRAVGILNAPPWLRRRLAASVDRPDVVAALKQEKRHLALA